MNRLRNTCSCGPPRLKIPRPPGLPSPFEASTLPRGPWRSPRSGSSRCWCSSLRSSSPWSCSRSRSRAIRCLKWPFPAAFASFSAGQRLPRPSEKGHGGHPSVPRLRTLSQPALASPANHAAPRAVPCGLPCRASDRERRATRGLGSLLGLGEPTVEPQRARAEPQGTLPGLLEGPLLMGLLGRFRRSHVGFPRLIYNI